MQRYKKNYNNQSRKDNIFPKILKANAVKKISPKKTIVNLIINSKNIIILSFILFLFITHADNQQVGT